jgi:hypothetical protein
MSKRFAKTDKRGGRGVNRAGVSAMRAAQAVRAIEAELHARGYSDADIREAIKRRSKEAGKMKTEQ